MSGCAGTGGSLSEYTNEATLASAARMPTEADLARQGRAKVVVFDMEDNNLSKARHAQAGSFLMREIEQLLGTNGIEVVDRNLANQLRDELKLAEAVGVAGYDGPSVANYAVKPAITQAEYDLEIKPATSQTNKKGKTVTTPASYSHSASVNVVLRVYEVPSLRLIKTLNGRGANSHKAEEASNRDLAVSMVREAAQKALSQVGDEFLEQFSHKGYILGRRDKGSKSIFKLSIGADQGVTAGSKVTVFNQKPSLHSITNKTVYDKVPVVEGVVFGNVTAMESWIIADDDRKAQGVLLGDLVEVTRKGSLWQKVLKPLQF
ncbi:MAG: hypothetical protein B7Y41_13670 [Hydrogenophilales bacterium 28-61-23]|nr:MAG: hypothetical protein B7Y41_13670 [Hydrogenophilales bacterium 28-61-23]